MNNKVKSATKWSLFSEILAKVIAPLTTIVLARLLSQEVFGIVASLTAITSLADMLADAGFNAYIVQHQFQDDKEKKAVFNICFWSNLSIATLLFLAIIFNNHFFSRLVGAEGYGNVLMIAALVIPMVSISSIEMAIMKRELNFKSLGIIKIISKFIPFVMTIPLALFGLGYWSLIIGSLVGEFVGVVLSVYLGRFIPTFTYEAAYLKNILSFSVWAYLESILEWLISNIAILTLATIYGIAALGVFKVGINLITQITTSVYSLYANVYKSALSREQYNQEGFRNIFLTFQKYSSMLSIPLGVGAFMYKDLVTELLLGKEWHEASIIIGLYGLMATFSIAFGNFYSDAIRAKGYPKKLVEVDFVYLALIIGLLAIARRIDFYQFCVVFCLLKFVQPMLQSLIGRKVSGISYRELIRNSYPQLVASVVMAAVIAIFGFSVLGIIWGVLSVILSSIIYFSVLYLLSPDKETIKGYLGRINTIHKRN